MNKKRTILSLFLASFMLLFAAGNVIADGTEQTTCVPVYGGGTTCEHVPVNTGFEDSFVYGMGGVLYIGGLASFVEAKRNAGKKVTRVTVH